MLEIDAGSHARDPVEAALAGKCIFGDDLSVEEIHRWFEDEGDGYANLAHKDSQSERYAYRAMDDVYGWPNTPGKSLRVLGIGSAFGLEFLGIRERLRDITIVEPARRFWRSEIGGIPARYVLPNEDGRLEMPDGAFDVVTCLGVLHHIPNVSAVFRELVRVLRPHGRILVREPITSMGDWRQPRRGLTARERGIPAPLFVQMVLAGGCGLVKEYRIGFAPLVRIANLMRLEWPWNNEAFVLLDQAVCGLFQWNYTYHRKSLWQRFAPSVGYWVVEKISGDAPAGARH